MHIKYLKHKDNKPDLFTINNKKTFTLEEYSDDLEIKCAQSELKSDFSVFATLTRKDARSHFRKLLKKYVKYNPIPEVNFRTSHNFKRLVAMNINNDTKYLDELNSFIKNDLMVAPSSSKEKNEIIQKTNKIIKDRFPLVFETPKDAKSPSEEKKININKDKDIKYYSSEYNDTNNLFYIQSDKIDGLKFFSESTIYRAEHMSLSELLIMKNTQKETMEYINQIKVQDADKIEDYFDTMVEKYRPTPGMDDISEGVSSSDRLVKFLFDKIENKSDFCINALNNKNKNIMNKSFLKDLLYSDNLVKIIPYLDDNILLSLNSKIKDTLEKVDHKKFCSIINPHNKDKKIKNKPEKIKKIFKGLFSK